MYKRLLFLTVIILAALGALTVLGYHALGTWARGLYGQRLGQCAEVAERIRQDVKEALDTFIQEEQARPYTDYLYYHVSQEATGQQQALVVRSPLTGRMEEGLAYGHFQIQPDGSIVTPQDVLIEQQGPTSYNREVYEQAEGLRGQIEQYLLPSLRTGRIIHTMGPVAREGNIGPQNERLREMSRSLSSGNKSSLQQSQSGSSTQALSIKSLQSQQPAQVYEQKRGVYEDNIFSNRLKRMDRQTTQEDIGQQLPLAEAEVLDETRQDTTQRPYSVQTLAGPGTTENGRAHRASASQEQREEVPQTMDYQVAGDSRAVLSRDSDSLPKDASDTVQVRIEPFVPVTAGGGTDKSVFGGQVFLLRHVQIDNEHFIQGFQLHEQRLLELVERSTRQVLPQGMDFLLSRVADEKAAYTAVMDFGFGQMVLNLFEANPAWIVHKVHWLQRWYMGTVVVVLLAVGLGLAGLWQGTMEQARLARKKDDFISAVSHELRTPLTSVRMYSEMLEKDWVQSREKQKRYYQNMRQETERLSRLVDNILDFSRVQRGRKQYHFEAGDFNACITQVVNMMRPFVEQQGFNMETDLAESTEMCFDRDAVTQIIVNLLDNAVKYARQAEDKTIQLRTRPDGPYVVIEVEDHGPGVPHAQRKRIFEPFYRTESESTRQTTGTGLGLALVKEFAEAHQGFVQVAAAKPTGAVFRIGLKASL